MKKVISKIIGLWNIYGGIIASTLIAWLSDFSRAAMDNTTSYLVLMLTCISVLTFFKIILFKQKSSGAIDQATLSQSSIKAMKTAVDPLANGEEIGTAIITTMKGTRKIMTKLKLFFDKFKGYLLTIALTILSLIDMCGGFLNDLMGDTFSVHGVNIISIVTLVCAILVGCISNGWSKEQKEKIKALFSKNTTNELVMTEIKKTIKEDEAKLKEFNKILATKTTELDNLNATLTSAKNTYEAKKEMAAMVPQLASAEDVQLAANEVVNVEARIVEKQAEITDTQTSISNLTTTINALKNQL